MMFGGLKKSASRLALVAAAGVLSTNAYAADLGGDCCADLEERVAELEATSARKGTRKTSLEVWGQVNKIIIGWNDGVAHNMALGIDNVNSSTRFGFRGMAKISPGLSAGYSIVVEQATGGRSTNVNAKADKASAGAALDTTAALTGFGSNDPAITMREANWWMESSTLGRLTVGRFVAGAGPQGQIDLGGISMVASGSESLITNTAFRTNAGAFAGYNLRNTTDAAGEYSTRQNGLMWSSPVLAGFTVSASYSGDVSRDGVNAVPVYGPLWALGLKYAGEFSGVRIAAAVGYENSDNANFTSMVATAGSAVRAHATDLGYSLSLMHVATGLFGQGFYNEYTRGHDTGWAPGTTKDTAKQWLVQVGIAKNWFGIGNTALFGEYGQTKNGYNTFGQETAGAAPNLGVPGGVAYTGDNTTNKMWGLGINQNIDAAAMEVYAGYRNYSVASDNCTAVGGCKDIGIFLAGSRIKF